MSHVSSFELNSIPLSLATTDGGLVKTTKSTLWNLFEDSIQPVEDVPPTATLIRDGMAVLQTTVPTGSTFGHLAEQVFRYATQGIITGGRVDFVVDRYFPLSIKSSEKSRRGTSGMVQVKIMHAGQKLPTWKKFLAVSENKAALTEFLLTQWVLPQYANRLRDCKLFSVRAVTAISCQAVMGCKCHLCWFWSCSAAKRKQTPACSCMPNMQQQLAPQ